MVDIVLLSVNIMRKLFKFMCSYIPIIPFS
jgi:hypothetical protein